MDYLLGLIIVLAGWVLVGRFKNNKLQSKLTELEALFNIQKQNEQLEVNKALLKAEEDLRNSKVEKKDATPEENADYFNNTKS